MKNDLLELTVPDDIDWVAVGTFDDLLIVVQWHRGMPCPTVVSHRAPLQVARQHFEVHSQHTEEVIKAGYTIKMTSSHEDGLWVALHCPDSPMWLPCDASGYMQ